MAAYAREIQERFRMTDGFELFCRRWEAVGESRKSVVCIHGIGGHSEDFRIVGQDLASDGIEVYALDLRGFANSKEEALPRGDTSDFNRHLQDVGELVGFVRERHREKKVYLFGYSLGVLYVLWYSANHPDSYDGTILAAPYWVGFMPQEYRTKIPSMLLHAPESLYDSYKRWPREFRESEEGKIIVQDPLYTTKRSWRWLGGVKRTLSDKALQNASKIKRPTLIILGENDDVTVRSGAKQLLESLAAKDKSIKTFPDADHFFYDAFLLGKTTTKHDPAKRKQVASAIKDWLGTH